MGCACRADDRYECWAIRHGMTQANYCQIDVDTDGGPCECPCHDEHLDDDGAAARRWLTIKSRINP